MRRRLDRPFPLSRPRQLRAAQRQRLRRTLPFQQAAVTYEVSVQANGCYNAQSPPSFVGQQTMRDAQGHQVVNPLFVVYGCFDPLG